MRLIGNVEALSASVGKQVACSDWLLQSCLRIDGAGMANWSATVELEHGDKPACVAQVPVRYPPVSSTG